ncbi:hypothetical protein BDU57DRAFT_73546 [Ampelomyces quisqualis]|uniref:Uncharacterized protein n=1 Tax=Ampelomyces quisqualis TaxID=50730 RepID=A0A6A5Q933_AMPQU|nr:hypothetical protein BDU57DRAFT_73546 [Ampelomyces quisqualis]
MSLGAQCCDSTRHQRRRRSCRSVAETRSVRGQRRLRTTTLLAPVTFCTQRYQAAGEVLCDDWLHLFQACLSPGCGQPQASGASGASSLDCGLWGSWPHSLQAVAMVEDGVDDLACSRRWLYCLYTVWTLDSRTVSGTGGHGPPS